MKTRPQYEGYEDFRMLHMRWDISKAWDLVERDEIEHRRGEVDVTAAAGMLWMIGIDRDYLEMMDETDLEYPLLITHIEDVGNLIIDGWHRVAKGLELGITMLPCVYLVNDDKVRTS